MLTDKTISIVKATAPILEEHGEALTRHFYKRMFAMHPEVAPFFNRTNQHTGTQQKALAAAICAYAANIDNLEVLGGAAELIAQKHASLQISRSIIPSLAKTCSLQSGKGETEQRPRGDTIYWVKRQRMTSSTRGPKRMVSWLIY
jgi:hemoglobin-like flavoprotein